MKKFQILWTILLLLVLTGLAISFEPFAQPKAFTYFFFGCVAISASFGLIYDSINRKFRGNSKGTIPAKTNPRRVEKIIINTVVVIWCVIVSAAMIFLCISARSSPSVFGLVCALAFAAYFFGKMATEKYRPGSLVFYGLSATIAITTLCVLVPHLEPFATVAR